MTAAQRIYFYKMTVDDGGAPHVADGLLSLAICKPSIRRTACRGDWIFGFASNTLDRNNRIIYVAVVTDKLVKGHYYQCAKFFSRGDCIYEWRSGTFNRRLNAAYHNRAGDLAHDLGDHPYYLKANTLSSDDFRYFGEKGTSDYKTEYRSIAEAVESLGRGHRVYHLPKLREELIALKADLWLQESGTSGPHTPPNPSASHRGGACRSC